MSLDDTPKKVQYVVLDSEFVNGTNNTFSLDLTLKSNTHVEDMSRVIGIKMVDFYVTQIGENDSNLNTNIAKYIDVVCPDVPKVAQMLDERSGQLLARIPLERHFVGASGIVIRDKQWKSFNPPTRYFNPISIKRLNFKLYEQQDDGDYLTLQPDARWFMVLEITTVNVKEKPVNKEAQILVLLEKLLQKLDNLNQNVQKLPDKPPDENPKNIHLDYLLLYWYHCLVASCGGLINLPRKNRVFNTPY